MKKTPFRLIEREPGGITYEHTLVEAFPKNVFIGASEINLYVDPRHEINLCVYYNAVKTNTYIFDNKYYYYITDGRACLDLYWNLGNPSRKVKIIKKYQDLEQLIDSPYLEYFKKMKERIEEGIKQRKDYLNSNKDEFDHDRFSYHLNKKTAGGEFHATCCKTKEYVRLVVNLKKDKWTLFTSKEDLCEVSRFFKKFDKLDKKYLHLQTLHDELDVKNLDKRSPYYGIVQSAKKDLGLPGFFINHEINPNKIEYMEYIHKTCRFPDGKIVFTAKIKYDKSGLITEKTTTEKGKKETSKEVSTSKMLKFYKKISKFLTAGRLKQELFVDDSNADLFIHFEDGHVEKYNRGLTRNEVSLIEVIHKSFDR